jgi:hypothetical protein
MWRKGKKNNLPKEPRSGKDHEILDEFKRGAQICIDTSRETFNVKLKLDEKSVKKLDKIISDGWGGEPPNQMDNMVMVFGSFLGEAMIATFNGRWVEDPDYGWGIEFQPKNQVKDVAMVFAKMEKRFRYGMDDSISFFYDVIKKRIAGTIP